MRSSIAKNATDYSAKQAAVFIKLKPMQVASRKWWTTNRMRS